MWTEIFVEIVGFTSSAFVVKQIFVWQIVPVERTVIAWYEVCQPTATLSNVRHKIGWQIEYAIQINHWRNGRCERWQRNIDLNRRFLTTRHRISRQHLPNPEQLYMKRQIRWPKCYETVKDITATLLNLATNRKLRVGPQASAWCEDWATSSTSLSPTLVISAHKSNSCSWPAGKPTPNVMFCV